jgi:endonuclease/exonuclease/phosphatase family metal-dependent hydrolase
MSGALPSTSAPVDFVVASFNLHAGVDGWGRPFDVVAAVQALDADVVALEENWSPEEGPGIAETLASALGYEVLARTLVSGRRAGPHPGATERWKRRFHWRGPSHALYLDSERALPGRITRSARYRQAQPGHWGLALLSRLPVHDTAEIDLGRLRLDSARRVALVARVEVSGTLVFVVAAHMAHLTYGSPIQFRRLRSALRVTLGDAPAVLAGDMNLWGPPVVALLSDWRRVVLGRTWPAWRPNSQVDHILVKGPLELVSSEVLGASGSDHRPVRAHLAIR